MTGQGELFPVIRIHCFFHAAGCRHVVDDPDPIRGHDRMEEHYEQEHEQDIERIAHG